MGGVKIFDPRVKLPKGYVPLDSFKMVAGTDALHDFDIGIGECRDTDDTNDIVVVALTKQIDVAWAVGNDAGGLDVAPPISTDVPGAVWAILRPDTGITDLLYSESFTAPALPTNYTKKQLVGVFFVDGSSEIRPMIHIGNYYRLKTPFIDLNDSDMADGVFKTGTSILPPKCLGKFYLLLNNATATGGKGDMQMRAIGGAEESGTGQCFASTTGSTFDLLTGTIDVLLDSSRQFEYACDQSDGDAAVLIQSVGCIMLTRGNP